MIIYQSTKAGFLNDLRSRDIGQVVRASYRAKMGRDVGESEVRAWSESLPAMGNVLEDDRIPDIAGVGIELFVLQSLKRIDFLVSGSDVNARDKLVIIELKQWETATKTAKDGIVVTRFKEGLAETSHPSYQAWSYASLLENFNEAVYESGLELRPCAYLHNYCANSDIRDAAYEEYLERAPVFLKGEAEKTKLQDFIAKHVKHGDRNKIIYHIDNGRIRPSKGLVDALVGMLAGKQEFVLVDDQKIVYETTLGIARAAAQSGQKQVVIVDGGPGTGKSVVAINLLVAMTSGQYVAKYVTKNAAPRDVFEKVLTGAKTRTQIANLFGGSGEFTNTQVNVFDALVVDEAHRLNEKSGLFGNLGEHQVDEIIGAAKCAIFFIDEDQRVTWKDIGDKKDIERRAKRAGAKVTNMALRSQFRCSGSDGYLAWLDNTLGIRETANWELNTREYEFRVFDSPEEMRQAIVEKNAASNKARMVAGYCWDWASKKKPDAMDIVLPDYGFAMQWNLAQESTLFVIGRRSVEQIGCIHTCQGLEMEYIGVIIGPDLVVRDGMVGTHPEKRARTDKSLHGYKKQLEMDPQAARAKADLIIKNTYRTLMTRGMKGCYVFCTDKETGKYFRGRLAVGE
jgi:DUF2075 family protein